MAIYAYFVNGDPSREHAIYRSTLLDSGSWSTREPVTIGGAVDRNAVDPNLNVLPDGRLLLTYMRGQFGGANPEANTTIYTAWSFDGLNFFAPQIAYRPASAQLIVTDPSLVRLNDGSWLMAVSSVSNSTAELFRSSNARDFSPLGVTIPTFSPDLQLTSTGSVRVFYAGPGGIISQVSSNAGLTWTAESGSRLAAAGGPFDPSVFRLADGSWAMIYKTQTPGTSGLQGHNISYAVSSDGSSFVTTRANFATSASVPEGVQFDPIRVAQTVIGGSGNDTIAAGPSGAWVNGGSGLDRVSIPYASGSVTIQRDSLGGEARMITVGTGADRPGYFLEGVERIQFSERGLALDLGPGEGASNTVRVIGASFGASAVAQRPEYVGAGLGLFDSGMSMRAVCDLVAQFLGLSNTAFVNTVYNNVVGVPPAAADRDYFVGLLQGSGGGMTQGELLMLAADADLNATSVGLVGLQQSGVWFV